jgi:phage tail sheath protein FI
LTKKVVAPPPTKLSDLKTTNTGAYNLIKAALGRQRITLPPSGAMAGVYARVDRERGVWKAPANVSVDSVVALTRTLTDEEQGKLNVDSTSGKSINAIVVCGRGTLVGCADARRQRQRVALMSVRRLFIMIESAGGERSRYSNRTRRPPGSR